MQFCTSLTLQRTMHLHFTKNSLGIVDTSMPFWISFHVNNATKTHSNPPTSPYSTPQLKTQINKKYKQKYV